MLVCRGTLTYCPHASATVFSSAFQTLKFSFMPAKPTNAIGTVWWLASRPTTPPNVPNFVKQKSWDETSLMCAITFSAKSHVTAKPRTKTVPSVLLS